MARLEDLIPGQKPISDYLGRDLDTIPDEELDELVRKGRLAREEEANSRFASKKSTGTKAKKTVQVAVVDFEIDYEGFD